MNFTVWNLTAWSNILLFKFPSTNCFPFSMHNWIVGSSRCIVYLFHLEHSQAIMHCLNTRDEEDKWRAKQLNSLSKLAEIRGVIRSNDLSKVSKISSLQLLIIVELCPKPFEHKNLKLFGCLQPCLPEHHDGRHVANEPQRPDQGNSDLHVNDVL